MPPHARRIAYCHLLLRGTRWIPVSVNRKLGPNDRSAPNGVVVSALLCAVIEKDTITEWLEHSAFSVQELQPDGSLSPLDVRVAALAMDANESDLKAEQSGAVGITSLISERRLKEQKTGGLARGLRDAAFERAAIQILDKLQDHSVVGVLLSDC